MLAIQQQDFVVWSPARDLLCSLSHSRYDVLGARPGFAQKFGKQSTLPGNDCSAVNDDVELPSPALFDSTGVPRVSWMRAAKLAAFVAIVPQVPQ